MQTIPRLLFALTLATTFVSSQDAPTIDWQTDLAKATKLAAERNAPMFVVFRCER